MAKKAQEDVTVPEDVLEQDGSPGLEWRNVASENKKPVWVKGYKERFHKVMFVERMSENETRDVQLMVNGEVLLIERGKEVVVPERFLECAQHTKQPRYKQMPNEPRKVIGYIQTYAYHILEKDVGEAAYKKMKAKGDKATKERLARQQRDDEAI